VAATQRITGGDEPTWPDMREPAPPRRRRRWTRVSLVAVLVAAGAAALLASRHHQPRVQLSNGLSCASDRIRATTIDYTWTSGPSSPEAAIDAFVHSVHGQGLPTSGYVRPTVPHLHLGDVTASVGTFDYVHLTNGRVDVGLRLDEQGGVWEVSEVEACG
jgi:hypothetical protein